jgi:CRISPR-associated endonuclease Cas2
MSQTPQHRTRNWLVAYDISGQRQRAQMARLLEGNGQRVQLSVFTTTCTQHEMVALLKRADSRLKEGDSILAFPVKSHSGLPLPWKRKQKRASLAAYWLA